MIKTPAFSYKINTYLLESILNKQYNRQRLERSGTTGRRKRKENIGISRKSLPGDYSQPPSYARKKSLKY